MSDANPTPVNVPTKFGINYIDSNGQPQVYEISAETFAKVMGTAYLAAGQDEEYADLYRKLGKEVPGRISRGLNRPLTVKTILIGLTVYTVIMLNEAWGAKRHANGKWHPTLFDGFSGKEVLTLEGIEMRETSTPTHAVPAQPSMSFVA
jgi:PHD/YefM family antitoxin component YafN of YafNO toxin-antitoxin module